MLRWHTDHDFRTTMTEFVHDVREFSPIETQINNILQCKLNTVH